MTDAPQTCGQGLAANSALPSKLAELLKAQASVLERHTRSIDRSDPNAAAELEAYSRLSQGFLTAAANLQALANEMASYRALPMPRHDPSVLTAPGGQMDAFRTFMSLERDLVALLQRKLEAEAALQNS